MARKKKAVKGEVTQPIEYKGEVRVKITDGKKIIANTKIKNNGKVPLFKFLARCLAGRYSEIDVLRPRFIQLFNISNTSLPFDSSTIWTACSSAIGLSTTPSVDSQDILIDSATCTIKFIIPFSMINFTEDKPINLIALKSAENAIPEKNSDVCAYIILDANERLIPQNLQGSDKYNIIIEWTLKLQN